MASNGSSSNHSPTATVSSPWSQIVASSSKDSDSVSRSNENGLVGRSVWNKPSNEESSSEPIPFISADSWPPLSQTTKASVKSLSQSAKPLMDPSSSSLVTGNGLPHTLREVRDNVRINNMVPAPQRPIRHSYSNQSSNRGHPRHLSVPQASMVSTGSHNNNSSPIEHQSRSGFVHNNHIYQRNSYRNGGPQPLGDGSHHHNYGRTHHHGNQSNWYTYQNFNAIDNYMSPRFGPRFPVPLASPTSVVFPSPPLMQPFGAHIAFRGELQTPIIFGPPPPPPMDPPGAVPVMFHSPIVPLHPPLVPCSDPQLHSKIAKQVEYYFSKKNLVKDEYLRRRMDNQGWVHINLVAGFNKVKQLTNDVNIVLNALRTSPILEVQGDKIRKREDWESWPLAPAV